MVWLVVTQAALLSSVAAAGDAALLRGRRLAAQHTVHGEIACHGLQEVCGDELDDADSCVACGQINELAHCGPKQLKASCGAKYDEEFEDEIDSHNAQSDKAGDDDASNSNEGDDDANLVHTKVTHAGFSRPKIKHRSQKWDSFKVQSVVLGNGVLMPQIGLGTWRLDSRPAYVEQIIHMALGAGFTHIDTSVNWNNERPIATAIHHDASFIGAGNKVFITSKLPPCSSTTPRACYQETKSRFMVNMAQLGANTLDLVLLQSPNCASDPEGCDAQACSLNLAQWRVLEKMYKKKLVRAIGVANYCKSCLQCLMEEVVIAPTVNQIQYHVGMGTDPSGLISYCSHNGIAIQAYSPLGSDGHITEDEVVKEVASELQKPAASVALKWILQQGHSLVVKTESRTHMAQDLNLYDWQLDSSSMSRLSRTQESWSEPSSACSQ